MKQTSLAPLLLILVSCGGISNEGGSLFPVSTQTWSFDESSSSSYAYEPGKIDLSGGVCRLTPSDQVDDDNSPNGFAPTASSGLIWDANGTFLRLDQMGTIPTNRSELDSSWAPGYSNLVAYWKLNGAGTILNGTTIPATIGPNAVTQDTITLSYAQGKLNQGVSFSPGGDRLKVSSALPLTNAYTFSFWINLRSFPATISAPISATSGGVYAWEIYFTGTYTSSGSVQYAIALANGTSVQNSRTITNTFTPSSLGAWHHVTVTYDSVTTPRTAIYMDGESLPMGLDNITGNFPAHDTIWIGGRRGDGNNCCDSSGIMDDVAVWNKALTSAEVQTIYARQSARYSAVYTSRVLDALSAAQNWTQLSYESTPDVSSLSGVQGLWHFNESAATPGSYNDFKDDSGQANHAESSGVTYGVAGRFDKGISLNGTSDYLIAAHNPSLNPNGSAFSVSTWFKSGLDLVTTSDINPLISKGVYSAGSNQEWWLGLRGGTTNGLLFRFRTTSVLDLTCTYDQSAALNDRTWHQATVTIDPLATPQAALYLDGALCGTKTSFAMTINPTENLMIGKYSTYFYKGSLDETAVWNRALSSSEVKRLYRKGGNRLKFQVRNCIQADCSEDSTGANWKGPDGTSQTYFSELKNTFSDFTNSIGKSRYFQYRGILESDDGSLSCNYGTGPTWCSPELKSVRVEPFHYDTSSPSVTAKTGISLKSLTSFTETVGSSCASGIGYNLGIGTTSANATWYYWDSATGWSLADGTPLKSSTAGQVSANGSELLSRVGAKTVFFKAYLKSSGETGCELNQLVMGGAW